MWCATEYRVIINFILTSSDIFVLEKKSSFSPLPEKLINTPEKDKAKELGFPYLGKKGLGIGDRFIFRIELTNRKPKKALRKKFPQFLEFLTRYRKTFRKEEKFFICFQLIEME